MLIKNKKFNDPSIIKNTKHIDLNDRNITNARFIQVNQWLQIGSPLTPKLYVGNALDQFSLVRNNHDNNLNNHTLANINSITLNKRAGKDNKINTKAYVDPFHQENERSRRSLGIEFYDESIDLVKKNNQDNDFTDNKLKNLDSVSVIGILSSDNELIKKKCKDDELDKSTIVRFDQTLENYLKLSVGNNTYNLTKYDKIQMTDATIIKYPNTSEYLL